MDPFMSSLLSWIGPAQPLKITFPYNIVMELRCAETTKSALKLQAAAVEQVTKHYDTITRSAFRTEIMANFTSPPVDTEAEVIPTITESMKTTSCTYVTTMNVER
jgi:hypothetical protein